MGFPRDQVVAALQATGGNAERAVDVLFGGGFVDPSLLQGEGEFEGDFPDDAAGGDEEGDEEGEEGALGELDRMLIHTLSLPLIHGYQYLCSKLADCVSRV